MLRHIQQQGSPGTREKGLAAGPLCRWAGVPAVGGAGEVLYRVETKNFNIDAVMGGELDPIIDALTMQYQAEALRRSMEGQA